MLMKLIAIDGIAEIVGEIVPEVQRTLDDIDIGFRRATVVAPRPAPRERETIGIAAVAGIEGSIATDLSGRDGARWDLIGGIPSVRIRHPRQRETVLRRALAVAHHAIELAQAVRIVPGAIIGVGLARDEQGAVANSGGGDAESAAITEAADRQRRHGPDAVEQADMHRPHRGKVAFVGEIRSLADVDRADQFGDQEIQVGISLAVGVGAHIDRHAVDRDGEIGAVIEIETAQEILVGLAVPAVLGDDQTRHDFERFRGPRQWSGVDSFAADILLARRRERCRRRTATLGR